MFNYHMIVESILIHGQSSLNWCLVWLLKFFHMKVVLNYKYLV